jgi:two-component system alkaline phosphatase synthesis response regulator PhoP
LLQGCVCCAAIVIEGALSDMSPMSLCRALKRECPNVPILYLVREGDEGREQDVLESGASLSLLQSTDLWEPIIQVCRLLRRSSPPRSQLLKRGPISVDLLRYVATAEGSILPLTRAQFDVLVHLLSSAGRVVTSDELAFEALGVRLRPGETGRVRVHIAHLRAALGPAARYLRTVRGRGYLWAA